MLTSSTLEVGGLDEVAGGAGTSGGDGAGGGFAGGGAGSAAIGFGGVTVLIKGGRDDRGPLTYCTAGFLSQTTVSEIRARAAGRVVVT